jgi:uncharacterized damage-inducible protein DinB
MTEEDGKRGLSSQLPELSELTISCDWARTRSSKFGADAPKLQEHLHGVAKVKTLEGFDFMAFFAGMINQEQLPHTKLEILTLLNEQGEHYAHFLESLSDSFLGEQVSMPAGMTPASKTRFEMLMGVKEHEMHHRAQLMLMQRMTGGVPHLTRQMNERMAAMMKAKA